MKSKQRFTQKDRQALGLYGESIEKRFLCLFHELNEIRRTTDDSIRKLESLNAEIQNKIEDIQRIQSSKRFDLSPLNAGDKIQAFWNRMKRSLNCLNLTEGIFKSFRINRDVQYNPFTASIQKKETETFLPVSNKVSKIPTSDISGGIINDTCGNLSHVHKPKLKKTQKSARAKASKEAL